MQVPSFIKLEDLCTLFDGVFDKLKQSDLAPDAALNFTDLRINLHCKNATYLNICKKSIFQHSIKNAHAPTSDIYIISPEDNILPAPPKWGAAIYSPNEVEQHLENTRYRASYFHDEGLWHIYDRELKIGLQWMAHSTAYPPWESAAPLRIFLHWIYAFKKGMRLVHAGTLAHQGNGVLITGRGGSGKSGTVFSGLINGLASVGDDYVLIENNGTQTLAHALFKTLKQDKAGAKRLHLDVSNKTLNWQKKYEFSAEELTGKPLSKTVEIKAILLPKVMNLKSSKIEPVSKAHAMLGLAPSGLFQMPGERKSGTHYYSSLIRKLPCYKLLLSNDREEIPHTITDFIAKL